MTSFRKYFVYHFRSTFLRFVIIAVLALLVVSVSVSVYDSTYYGKDLAMGARYQDVNISVLNTLAAIISTVIPILELVPFKNKRNMDTMLFLPIGRRKMAAVHFINGFIHVFLINFVCFLAAFFILIANSAIILYPWSFPLLFAVNLLGSFIVYSVTAFIFDRANTTADGIVWLVIYSFIGVFIFAAGRSIYEDINRTVSYPKKGDFLIESSMSPYSVLLFLGNSLHKNLFRLTYVRSGDSIEVIQSYRENVDSPEINGAILWSAIAIACAFGFIWLFKNKRPEEIGGISSSPFGYKVLLPVTAIAVINFEADEIALIAIMLVVMIVGYIIYRRSIRFKLWDYISMAIGLLVPLAIGIINSVY